MARRPPTDTPKKPTKRALTVAQRDELARFAELLTQRMRAENVSIARLARWTTLRPETLRSYMNGKNRPTKGSLRRLTMIFGNELAEPFAGTELAGPDEVAIDPIYLPDGRAILIAYAIMPQPVLTQILQLLQSHQVGEQAAPLYAPRR